jgi:hypothetical protein
LLRATAWPDPPHSGETPLAPASHRLYNAFLTVH